MVVNKKIGIQTKGNCELVDITRQVAGEVARGDIESGIVTIFITGSTAGVSTIEYESGLVSDFQSMWERTVPRDMSYEHDRAWGDGNGHSHVRASLLGPSLVIPFVEKRLQLGTWQQVVVVDFDNRPRSREIVLQIIGD